MGTNLGPDDGALGAIDVAIGPSRRVVLRNQVDELSAKQSDDETGGRCDADPSPVDAAFRQFDVAGLREPNHPGRVAEMSEAIEDLVALGFERAVIEMRIGLRAGGCPIRLERGVLVQLADVASAHA